MEFGRLKRMSTLHSIQKRWFEKPMRIIALQGGAGKTPLVKVPGIISKMGFNVEQVPRCPKDTLDSLEITRENRENFRRYLSEIKENRMRFILYLNIHVLEKPDRYREWAQRAADGSFPKFYGTKYAVCLNSPWRDYFFEKLEEYAEYDIDGVFLDGPSMVPGGCFCPHCRKRYREQYGEEMTPEKDRFDFYRRTQDDFLNEAYRRFKKLKTDGIFYMNFHIAQPSTSYFSLPDALAYNDIVGTEAGFQFYGPPKDSYLWRVSTLCKIMEAVVPDKPRVNFMAADQKSWSLYMHTPAETKLCIASTVANGANLWYGPHGPIEVMNTPGGRAGIEMVQFLAENERFYENTVSACRVAVMYSFATVRHYRTISKESDLYGRTENKQGMGNFTASFQGFCDALARSGIPYDVVTDLDFGLDGIDSYDCIFLPTCACLSDKAVKKLKGFAAKGGTLIGSFDTSVYNEEGEKRSVPGLKEVFGINRLGSITNYKRWNYLSRSGKHPVFKGIDIPVLPAPEYGFEVKVHGKAEVLARFHGVMAGRYDEPTAPENPAVVLNLYKKGTGIYLAGTFGEMMDSYAPPEYRRMVASIVKLFTRNTVSVDPAGNVEVVVRRQKDRMLVHLVNYTGLVPRPFEKVVPLQNLRVHIKGGKRYSRIFALVDRAGCSVKRRKNGRLEITIKNLNAYEVVVLE
jgi:hypothetical protein